MIYIYIYRIYTTILKMQVNTFGLFFLEKEETAHDIKKLLSFIHTIKNKI